MPVIVLAASFCSYGGEPIPFSPVADVRNEVSTSGQERRTTTIMADSTWSAPFPEIAPSTAMYHSLILPGWGQINNGKKKKAALFIAAEVICIGGYLYENNRVKNDAMTDWERDNVRTDRNTFIIYWMISKVLGIVDAYVDAHLASYNVKDITPEELRGTQIE